MATTMSLGELKLKGFTEETKVVAQVKSIEEWNGKLKCVLDDGKENVNAVITSQLAQEHGATLKAMSTVTVTQGMVNQEGGKYVLVISGLSVELGPEELKGSVAGLQKEPLTEQKPVQGNAAEATPAKDVKTPGLDAKKPAINKTPVSKAQPISSLNPYIHGWSIRAKVMSKGPKRSFTNNQGVASSVFSAELVDEEGTAIEGTFWRDAADRFYDVLEEGKVFTLSRGKVKPANKNYNRTRNDYCLNFDGGSMVEPCEDDIDASSITTRMSFVSIDQLPAFVDKKAPVDLIGVVTSVGMPSSVKRKSDASELQRRDVIIADSTAKTVSVTLWGEKAESEAEKLHCLLQGGEHPVVAISACRVSSYNGVSVSATMRSNILVNPDSFAETSKLRSWYDTMDSTETLAAVGEGLMSAAKSSGKKRAYSDLSTIKAEAPSSPDDKPSYATVNAMLASINPDQTLYYLACPENNRKVVEQSPGMFYCEYDGKTYPVAIRRYIASARIIDCSGELPIQVFNDQAEQIIGQSADRIHEIRESNAELYKATLKGSTWNEWTMRIKCQAQEYNGEIRQRYAIADIKPMDYASETRRVIDLIRAN